MKTMCILMAVIITVWTSISFAQAGSLDPDFGGGDGQVATAFIDQKPCQAYAVAVREDGKVFVSGITRGANNTEHTAISCYLPDGTLDHSFNGNGKMIISINGTNSFSQAIAIQPDDKILVVIRADDGEETNLHLYRFNPDGSPDTSFDGDGMVTTDFNAPYLNGRAITLQPDGKILVGGYLGFEEPFDKFYIVRYMPDGTLDPQFDGDGIITTMVGESYTSVASLLVQPNGKIIAAGYAVIDSFEAFAVARYHANGTLDQSFNGDGLAFATFEEGDDRANGAVLQPDGKIVLGGLAFSTAVGKSIFAAARFNQDGTLDNTFHGDGMTTVMLTDKADQARDIILQPDGKIVLSGFAHSANTNTGADAALVRLNENGIPDITFDGDGVAIYEDPQTSGEIHRMALQPDGKIVGAGVIRTDGLNAIRVARIITGLTVSTKEENIALTSASLFPNPASEQIFLEYTLEKSEIITIQLCDLQGRVVKTVLPSVERQAGMQRENLHLDQSLPPGSYLVNIRSKDWIKTLQVMIE